MREIKFRGKDKESGLWVYGSLWVQSEHSILIHSEDGWNIVCPETVGQFTGLYDKNGKEIYEGDVVEFQFCQTKYKAIVEYDNKNARFHLNLYEYYSTIRGINELDGKNYFLEVIGNIHDIFTIWRKNYEPQRTNDLPSTIQCLQKR